MSRRTIIVVPCYNEAARLDLGAFAGFLGTTTDVAFLFVDDGSGDSTADLLTRFCRERDGRCRVLKLSRNQGKAEAVRRGLLAALDDGGEYIGFWDADLATPLEAIPAFRRVLDEHPGVQAVIGARVQLLGRSIERRAVRHYLGRVFATAVSLILRIPVYDTQCGAKLFRSSRRLAEILKQPFYSTWVFDVELLARFLQYHDPEDFRGRDAVVHEFPLTEWRDVAGSKLRLRDFLGAFLDIVRIYWRVVRRRPASRPTGGRSEVGRAPASPQREPQKEARPDLSFRVRS